MASDDSAQKFALGSIDLKPQDWLWVSYRARTPLKRPKTKPFDQQAALAYLARIPRRRGYGFNVDWARAKMSASLSRQEAHFWFVAMTEYSEADIRGASWGKRGKLLAQLVQKLSGRLFDAEITLDQVRHRLAHAHRQIDPKVMIPLNNLFSPRTLVDLILDKEAFSLATILKGTRWPSSTDTG